MSPAQRVLPLVAAVLSVSAPSCSFETSPIFALGAQDGGVAQSFDAALPPTPHAELVTDSAPSAQPTAAPGATPTQTPPPPVVQQPTLPPPAPAAAGSGAPAAPPPAQCDGLGSYALQLALDVTWESAPGFGDPGRGLAKLYALVQVDSVDATTHALHARARVCGLALPTLTNSNSCQQREFHFDDKLWSEPTLPPLPISGNFACAADGCTLQIDPSAYALGIRLDPAAPWPAPGAASIDQFSDDDADGLPGISAEVVTRTAPDSNPSCGFWLSMQGQAQGQGPDASMMMNQGQRLLLALRTQLSAALKLAADCRVDYTSALAQFIDLRAAGCAYQTAADAGNTSCPDELRSAIDQSMPQYHVLAAGETPTVSMPARDTTVSRGTQLNAIRFAPGAPVSCTEVREAMF